MKFSFLNDENGDQSSKRLFTLILMMLWVVYFFSNLYYGKSLKDSLEEYLFYMLIVAYGGVALEGWKEVFKGKDKQPTSVTKTTETTETKETIKKDA